MNAARPNPAPDLAALLPASPDAYPQAIDLVRGLVLVVIAYMIYSYLVPPDRQYAGVREAHSLPIILSVAEMVKSVIPPDIAESITNATNVGSSEEQRTQPAAGESGQSDQPEQPGYQNDETQGLDQLIQGGQGGQTEGGQQPSFGGQTNPN